MPHRLTPPPHPVYWVIAASLAVIAAVLVVRTVEPRGLSLGDPAWAQTLTTSAGARGVFAFSGQLSKSTYGVFLVDVDAMTLWAYEYQPQKECLRLAAARTWRYDRYLESHNVCDLPPEAVEKMIEDQRQYRLQAAEQKMP
ncbi:MAG: hypothetical protein HY763_07900 [Planctomycetes bacterium]|nr:hypothetical protein [Planctomycetota bacterium]